MYHDWIRALRMTVLNWIVGDGMLGCKAKKLPGAGTPDYDDHIVHLGSTKSITWMRTPPPRICAVRQYGIRQYGIRLPYCTTVRHTTAVLYDRTAYDSHTVRQYGVWQRFRAYA
eukprot:gene12042-biopygen8782